MCLLVAMESQFYTHYLAMVEKPVKLVYLVSRGQTDDLAQGVILRFSVGALKLISKLASTSISFVSDLYSKPFTPR